MHPIVPTPDPDTHQPPAVIVAAQPTEDGPPPSAYTPCARTSRPEALPPKVAPKSGPNLAGMGALLTLVGAPAVANATDLAQLPPELGAWGLVAYALVRVVQELLVWRRENAQDQSAREENARLRERVAQLEGDVRRREEREDEAQREEIRALRARLERSEATR